jgi:ADP-ribose pyrophosphatase
MDRENLEEKTVKRNEIFHGNIIDFVVDEVRLPDGKMATRELVFHHGAVAIMAVDDQEKMLFVRQFRKPMEKITLEIPAGKIDPGEENTPEQTAKRELEEETDYQANHWEKICGMYSTPGFSNEFLTIYWAEELHKAAHPLAADEDEFLSVVALTLAEAKAEIVKGTICDAKTIYAVTYWELRMLKGR